MVILRELSTRYEVEIMQSEQCCVVSDKAGNLEQRQVLGLTKRKRKKLESHGCIVGGTKSQWWITSRREGGCNDDRIPRGGTGQQVQVTRPRMSRVSRYRHFNFILSVRKLLVNAST